MMMTPTSARTLPSTVTVAGDALGVTTPTRQTYHELQWAYDHFNRALFDDTLPPCLITLQRGKATFGYFSSKRFAHADGRITDEIALNPAYFAVVPLLDTLQTLVHEISASRRFDSMLESSLLP